MYAPLLRKRLICFHGGQNAVLLANTIYRPALQRLVDNGSAEGAQKDWSTLDGLRYMCLFTYVLRMFLPFAHKEARPRRLPCVQANPPARLI